MREFILNYLSFRSKSHNYRHLNQICCTLLLQKYVIFCYVNCSFQKNLQPNFACVMQTELFSDIHWI